MESPPPAVLARYAPALGGLSWVRVGGGFSGADVFRGSDRDAAPLFALKGWPPEVVPARVSHTHAWVRRAAHLPFVPKPIPTADGSTLAVGVGRVWDVAHWMPGTPRTTPTRADVEAACEAVARLHAAWPAEARAPAPAVAARLRALSDFRTHFAAGLRIPAPIPPTLAALLRRGRDAVARLAPAAELALRPWESAPAELRPCVRDLRGAHVLFTGSAVTGVIDFGAAAVDHPAGDLARLLGDLAGDDDGLFAAGLAAYGGAEALDAPDEFVRLLDRTGAVGSVVGWLVRLVILRQHHPDEAAVAARLEHLLPRVERVEHF